MSHLFADAEQETCKKDIGELDHELPKTDFNSLSASEIGAIKIAHYLHGEKLNDVQAKKMHELFQDEDVRACVLEQQGVRTTGPPLMHNASQDNGICAHVHAQALRVSMFFTGDCIKPIL